MIYKTLQLNSNISYRSIGTIEAIYTGGPCAVSRDEERLFCTVNSDVYIVDLKTGHKITALEGVCVD
jgi:hypothetical protein